MFAFIGLCYCGLKDNNGKTSDDIIVAAIIIIAGMALDYCLFH